MSGWEGKSLVGKVRVKSAHGMSGWEVKSLVGK